MFKVMAIDTIVGFANCPLNCGQNRINSMWHAIRWVFGCSILMPKAWDAYVDELGAVRFFRR